MTVDPFDNSYKRNIWVIPAAGGEAIQLTRSGKDSQPRWSPDSRTLAFVSARDKKPQIYLLRITGPVEKPGSLQRYRTELIRRAWSPDNSQIAFCRR
jgi:Tol biopolymer transport system component